MNVIKVMEVVFQILYVSIHPVLLNVANVFEVSWEIKRLGVQIDPEFAPTELFVMKMRNVLNPQV